MLKTRISRTRQNVFRIIFFDCYLWEGKEYVVRIVISQNSNTFGATRSDKDSTEAIWRAFCTALSCKSGLLEGAKLSKAGVRKDHDDINTAKVFFAGNGVAREGEGRDKDPYRAIAEALVFGVNALP